MIKNKRQIYIIISWVAVLLWMLLIFSLSSQVAEQSDKLSSGIANFIVKTIQKVTHNAGFDIKDLDHIVRKNAHFCVYLVLGVLVANALRKSRVSRWRIFIFAIGICVLYAASDEIHQVFVSGRGPGVIDVFIDSAGAAIGIGIYMIVSKIVEKRNKTIEGT